MTNSGGAWSWFSRTCLYYLHLNTAFPASSFAANSSLISAKQWHSRLGHPSLSKLKLLSSTLKSVSSLQCESCQQWKQPHSSFSISVKQRSFKPFDLAHNDVWGPLSVTNASKYKYYHLFIDDFTRMTWLYLLHDLSEVSKYFEQFTNEVKSQYSAVIKIFRFDNALEYKTGHFQSLIHSNGILHETSCFRTPQQNGVAERKHRHLLEVTRCLMLNMNVPKHFWPEALMTACYLINRQPSSVLNAAGPFSLMFPNQPPFHLTPWAFGCTCFCS